MTDQNYANLTQLGHPTALPATPEAAVLEATGCTKMIWLDHGLDFDDDTNGHIDNWACFVAPGVVVLAWTDDADDDADIEHVCETNNYERCRAALAVLEAVTDAKGRALTVHKLYLPKPMFYTREIVDSLLRVVGDDKTELDNPRQVGDRCFLRELLHCQRGGDCPAVWRRRVRSHGNGKAARALSRPQSRWRS